MNSWGDDAPQVAEVAVSDEAKCSAVLAPDYNKHHDRGPIWVAVTTNVSCHLSLRQGICRIRTLWICTPCMGWEDPSER